MSQGDVLEKKVKCYVESFCKSKLSINQNTTDICCYCVDNVHCSSNLVMTPSQSRLRQSTERHHLIETSNESDC